ncbi:hypothetical protein J4465_01295 [Candidatus Pacearchaeota archaeon]|nr:hypothetical protein [Candidatus Pacearchaeota archaeon]
MKRISLLILILSVLIILGLASFFLISNLRNINQGLAGCTQDSDCVKVQTSCCPCNMGGQEKCVRYNILKNYQDNLNACPSQEKLVCLALYNCEITSCGCINGTCVSTYSA